MIHVEFTADEAGHLRALLDAAVKAAGLEAAVIAVPIVQKIAAALNDAAAKQKVVPISRAKARKQPAA